MVSLLAIVLAGFLLGMRHATDSDHVIAVTTIVSRQRAIGHAALIGVLWGIGHTITIFVVGTVIILFSVTIPPRVGLSMELSVGLMLILLGILNLTGAIRWLNEHLLTAMSRTARHHQQQHPQQHEQQKALAQPLAATGVQAGVRGVEAGIPGAMSGGSDGPDSNPQVARAGTRSISRGRVANSLRTMGVFQTLRPLIVGVVHGLAGSAAVALLVLTTIRNPWWALGYLLVFGIGTIAGMMLITSAIAVPIAYSTNRFSTLSKTLAMASGALSIAFGAFLTYQIGIVNGLLTNHPHWTPR